MLLTIHKVGFAYATQRMKKNLMKDLRRLSYVRLDK